jgi:hypothetical protein
MPTYQSSVSGAIRTTADTLGYPWIEVEGDPPAPVEEQTEFTKQTADAILLEVGNDAELAQLALDEEEASETPRTSLIAKLERIVRNAES